MRACHRRLFSISKYQIHTKQRHLPGRHHDGLSLTNQGEGMRDPPFFFTLSDLNMTEWHLTFRKSNQTSEAAVVRKPYSHAVEGQLAVHLELVGRGHPPTGVHQRVTELEERNN